nr:ATP-dependent RNA helicase DEAH11, chloroplastic-like [Tanacetum cinerariifolium]
MRLKMRQMGGGVATAGFSTSIVKALTARCKASKVVSTRMIRIFLCRNEMNSDKILKEMILSALAENVATYTGNDNLCYEVASIGSHVQLHPSCSLLMFGERPKGVVFGEIIALPNQELDVPVAYPRPHQRVSYVMAIVADLQNAIHHKSFVRVPGATHERSATHRKAD